MDAVGRLGRETRRLTRRWVRARLPRALTQHFLSSSFSACGLPLLCITASPTAEEREEGTWAYRTRRR